MSVAYDKYYQSENLFGKPYPALVAFFEARESKGQLLDLGCGQGRNALALARMGYSVTGIDHSKVGLAQMSAQAKEEKLAVNALLADLYLLEDFEPYDIILLDSLFHFGKQQRAREMALIAKILTQIKLEAMVVICLQDTGEKVKLLRQTISSQPQVLILDEQAFTYVYKDQTSGHSSKTPYCMIVLQKPDVP